MKTAGTGTMNARGSDGSVKYREIADTLRREILAGKYPPGSRFPSLQMLCRRFGVSYLTAVKAQKAVRRWDSCGRATAPEPSWRAGLHPSD